MTLNLVDLEARSRAEVEIVTLAHELVASAEENPAQPVVGQLVRRIAQTFETLAH